MKKYDVRKVVSSIMKSFNTEYATESQMESALERALTTAETEIKNEPWETLLEYIKNSKPKVVRVKFHDEKWYYGVPSHSGVNIALYETNSVYADMKCMCTISSSLILDWKQYVENEPIEYKHQWMFQYNSDAPDVWRRESEYLTLAEARQKHPKAERFMLFDIMNCNGVRFVEDW